MLAVILLLAAALAQQPAARRSRFHGRDASNRRARRRRRVSRSAAARLAGARQPPPAPEIRARASTARRADLSRRAVPGVVRRRPRPALLPVRHRRRRSWMWSTFYRTALKQTRRTGVRCAGDAPVRHRTVPRGDDGVSAERDGQGVPVAGVAGLPEPAGRTRSRRASRRSSRSCRPMRLSSVKLSFAEIRDLISSSTGT